MDSPRKFRKNGCSRSARIHASISSSPTCDCFRPRRPSPPVSNDITTDVNGIARFQYSINTRRDGSGTYLVNVTASKTGYNSGSGATSLTATK